MKLIGVYSSSHETFKDEWFLRTLKDDYEVCLYQSEARGHGKYMEADWQQAVRFKSAKIIETIQKNWGEVFVYSDMDVLFVGPTKATIQSCLNGKDIVCQLDDPAGNLCAGFFAIRANDVTLKLWQQVQRATACEGRDQIAFNRLVRAMEVRAGYLPPSFFGMGTFTGRQYPEASRIYIPENPVMFHANWTIGVEQKTALLNRAQRIITRPRPGRIANNLFFRLRHGRKTPQVIKTLTRGDPILRAGESCNTMLEFRRTREILLKAIRVGNHVGKALQARGWGRYLIGRIIVDFLLWPSDFLIVRRTYASVFGRPPKLLCPKTFNEKLQRSKLFRRRSRYTIYADKIALRDYVKQMVGSHVLTKLYWTGTNLRMAPHGTLPKKFVIKANHCSGTNLIVNNRDTFNWNQAYEQTSHWLKQDFSEVAAEWQYRWIEPRLLIEEFLESEDGMSPPDYKFFCFRGRVEMVEIRFDRFLNHAFVGHRAFVGRNFEVLQLRSRYGPCIGALVPPPSFSTMIGMAEALARREPFIRVDLYDVGRPIFGELTLHPWAGLWRFDPPEYDVVLGKLIP
jgi:TupA-like ATPgrasp/Nucleotide-diphospho-sugar transferase